MKKVDGRPSRPRGDGDDRGAGRRRGADEARRTRGTTTATAPTGPAAPAVRPDRADLGDRDPGVRQASATARRIEHWFEGAARALPWRRRRSGWRALVAEIMLQQTQASRVAERFEDFMRRFPSPRAMAEASDHDVLAAWQGMGYYRRAKLLRRAAIEISRHHGGRVPRRAEVLRRLPGVGRYTAGAVASIVFGERTPIVDGNVSRVILRLRGVGLPLRDPAAQALAWRAAAALVEASASPGVLNEGLMELGAVVCTPKRPRCGDCPIGDVCLARAEGAVDRIPAPPRTKAPRIERVDALVALRRGSVLLAQRPATGMWPSMWEPPALDSAAADVLAGDVGAAVDLPGAGAVSGVRRAGELRHRTSHRDFRIRIFVVDVDDAPARRGGPPGRRCAAAGASLAATSTASAPRTRWVALADLGRHALSNAAKAVLALAGAATPPRAASPAMPVAAVASGRPGPRRGPRRRPRL